MAKCLLLRWIPTKATALVVPAEDAAADETVPPLLSPAWDDIMNTLMGSVVDRLLLMI